MVVERERHTGSAGGNERRSLRSRGKMSISQSPADRERLHSEHIPTIISHRMKIEYQRTGCNTISH